MADIGFNSNDPRSSKTVGYRSHKVARKSIGSSTNYFLQGSDISYNGFTFPPTVRCKATVIPEYNKARTSIKWHTVALDIECFITQYDVENFVPNTSVGDTTDSHMDAIKKRLMQPCQKLSFTLQGFGNIQVQGASPSGFTVSGDVNYDVNYGPNPQALEWEPMGGGLCGRIQYLITTSIPACSTTNGLQGIVDFWYEISWNIGDGGFLRRNVSGGIELAATRSPISGDIHASPVINLAGNKAQYNIALSHIQRAFPVLNGWHREEDYKLSANKKILNFTFSDEEIMSPQALPAGILRARVTESVSTSDMSFYQWDWGFSAEIEVPNSKKQSDIPNNKRMAFTAFGMILKERLDRQRSRVKQLEVETDQAASLSKAKSIVAIPVSMRVSNEIYGNSISVDVNYLLTCPPSELWNVTGMFSAVNYSGLTWDNWRKFLENTGSRVPYFDPVPNAELIVDLCHPIASSPGESPSQKSSSFGGSTFYPEAPKEESSWIKYDNEFQYETEHSTVTGVLLSPEARELRQDDSLSDTGILNSDRTNALVVSPGPSAGSSSKAFTPNFTTAAEPITYVRMVGKAIRIGYPINAPILMSVGGTPVVQVGTDVVTPFHKPSGFIRNGKPVTMYGLKWERLYALTGPPRRNWKLKSNADPAIYT